MKNTGIEHSVESVYFPRVRSSILSPSLRQTPFSDPGTTLLRFCDEVEQKKPGPEGGKKKVHYSRPSKSPKAISVLMPKELCLALGPVGLLSPSEGGLTTPTPTGRKHTPGSQSAIQLCSAKSPPAVLDGLSFTVWTDGRLPSDGHPLRAHGIRHQGVRLRTGGPGTRVWAPPEESFPRHSSFSANGPVSC